MPLAWNEIRHRAIKFANDWKIAVSESADKQTCWNEFFDVFGIARKMVASFEAPVKKLTGHDGAIDWFWPGNLVVEHKSLGGSLSRAQISLPTLRTTTAPLLPASPRKRARRAA